MLTDTILEKIQEQGMYEDKDTDTIYRIQCSSQNKRKHECFIWKNNKRFMLTPTMTTKNTALLVAAIAIAGNILP